MNRAGYVSSPRPSPSPRKPNASEQRDHHPTNVAAPPLLSRSNPSQLTPLDRARAIVKRALGNTTAPDKVPPSGMASLTPSKNPQPLSRDAAITHLVQQYIHSTAKGSVSKVKSLTDTYRRNNFLSKQDLDYMTQIFKANANFMSNLEKHVEDAALRDSGLGNNVVRQAFEIWTHCKEMNEQIGPVILGLTTSAVLSSEHLTSSPRRFLNPTAGGRAGSSRAGSPRGTPLSSPRAKARQLPSDFTQVQAPRGRDSPSPRRNMMGSPRDSHHYRRGNNNGGIGNSSRLSPATAASHDPFHNVVCPEPSDVRGLQILRDRFVQQFGLMEGQRQFQSWVGRQPLDWLRAVRKATERTVAPIMGRNGGHYGEESQDRAELENSNNDDNHHFQLQPVHQEEPEDEEMSF